MLCFILILAALWMYERKKYVHFLWIYIFLLTDGYQIFPSSILTYGFVSKLSYDAALIILIYIIFRSVFFKLRFVNEYKYIYIFLVYLIFNILYSIFVLNYPVGDTFKASRNYFFLLTFVLIELVPLESIVKISRQIIIATLCISMIYLLQIFFGITLLNGAEDSLVGIVEEIEYKRFYNIPFLIDTCFFLVLLVNPLNITNSKRVFLLVIFGATILGPLHRSYIVTYVLIFVIYLFLYERLKNKIFYAGIIFIMLIMAFTSDVIMVRINSAIEDILSLKESLALSLYAAEGSTLSYRFNHFLERFDYIILSGDRLFMGIGLVDEKSVIASKLNFQFGLFNKELGRRNQVYTADLIWSSLILSFGFLGTTLYMLIFVKFWSYFRNSKSYNLFRVGVLLLLISILTSFSGVKMLLPTFYFELFLVYRLCKIQEYNYKLLIE